ncbi:MAG TPA: trigger factor [Gemmatimonadaceae bacterium]|nr:trigger factor [Gemmatimonadaceae bacterium]
MDIQVTDRKSSGAERRLRVSVSASSVDEARERAAKRVARQVRVPGFRPGKAPPNVVRKQYADAIRQEALDTLMREAYLQVIESEKLDPVTQPHAHDVKFADGEPLTFELHCEVRPDVALQRLEGFRVKRPRAAVTDDAVAAQVEQLRNQKATWTPVDERPREGDLVTVRLAVTGASDAAAEGKEYRLELGAGQVIGAIEELIMELAPGGAVERPVRWPDDFPDEAQRGQTKTVRVELSDVKRKSLPALDDSLARELGDFETLDALRETVRTDLATHAERDADAAVRSGLLDEILNANPFDVPPSWVNRLTGAYAEAYQIAEPEMEKFAGEFRPAAERQVRRDMVIDTIADREKLSATEQDVDDKVAELAAKRGAKAGEVYATLQKAGRLKEIERSITEERVFAWLLERNTVEQE